MNTHGVLGRLDSHYCEGQGRQRAWTSEKIDLDGDSKHI